MASKPKIDATPIGVGYSKTERFFVSTARPLNFGSDDHPILLGVPEGVVTLTVQARRCGDYYAEVEGKDFCRAAVAADLRDATTAAFAQVSAS